MLAYLKCMENCLCSLRKKCVLTPPAKICTSETYTDNEKIEWKNENYKKKDRTVTFDPNCLRKFVSNSGVKMLGG